MTSAPADLPVKRFPPRSAWEAWLAKNHETSSGAGGPSGSVAGSPPGPTAFAELDSQNRYAILYRPHDAKRADTRQRRLSTFMRMLEAGETLHPRK